MESFLNPTPSQPSIPEGAFECMLICIGAIGVGYLLFDSGYLLLRIVGFIIMFLSAAVFITGFPSPEKDAALKLNE